MSSTPKVLAVIPARYASTRLPGKPLIKIAGREMILRVCDQLKKANSLDDFVVATDDERIHTLVTQSGYSSLMTMADHPTGTDRMVEVANQRDADLYLNVQGDEPFLDPSVLDDFLTAFERSEGEFDGGTMASPLKNLEELSDPNVVKVVIDHYGKALYFSRAGIPYDRESTEALDDCYRHIGVYLYKRQTLLEYPKLKSSALENREKLEQLRLLQNGKSLFVYETTHHSMGIDTPQDLQKAEEQLRS